jgi:predicted dehydrogenase
MVGLGMIFEDTYRPLLGQLHAEGLYRPDAGAVEVDLVAVASRTGLRGDKLRQSAGDSLGRFINCSGPQAVEDLLAAGVDVVCIATPDDRHFAPARKALEASKHVLIEKPSVLTLQELDELVAIARRQKVLCKVVYHKLADPDHKKLRTHVVGGVFRHVNSGYCSLLESKQISGQQFSEWITGRNPGTYVAVHYIKLIDFTFGAPLPCRLSRIHATGQRGIVGFADGPTWDSTQLQLIYTYDDGREAAFDIHTSWVTPDNFPGHVEQEVQFRFDNGVWSASQRQRGVEMTVEGRTPLEIKETPNHHYSTPFLEPWGERSRRGYGIEVLRRFFEEVAFVELGGPRDDREERLQKVRSLAYNDIEADRPTVAAVQALEAILEHHRHGRRGGMVVVNDRRGGLVLLLPGSSEPVVLYSPAL